MHAGFPVSVWQFAQRQRVIKVLCVARVDGECCHAAHVLAGGYDLRCYSCVDFVGGSLHVLRVYVRQTVFGKDGVHLRVVFSRSAENVDHLAGRVLVIVVPVHDAHNCLVAAFAAFDFRFWYKNVAGKEFAVGHEEGVVLAHLQSADKHLLFFLYNLKHLRLRLETLALCAQMHAHAVAVEGVL